MRLRASLLSVLMLVGAAGCGGGDSTDDLAEAYGYDDTVATVAGPPPTQPPDPVGLGTSTGSAAEGSTATDGAFVSVPGTQAQTVVAASTNQAVDAVAASANPACVVQAREGDTVDSIVHRLVGVEGAELRSENGLGPDAHPEPGELLDVCIGNNIFDTYGTSRVAPSGEYAKQLQTALNRLLEPTSMLELTVDGDAGKLTQQATCAARALIGLPVSTGYPIAGSPEAEALLTATDIAVPAGAPVEADHWLLIDKTCQVMFAGEHDVLIDVYPTSTGAPGYSTASGDFEGYRFDPALDTDGWHDSTAYPTEVDDPKNGNMYKPLYFNGNEAIHGAGYIPPEPRSKGCARTFPEHQDKIIAWLGLDELDDVTWKTSVIDLTVVVRGRYLTPTGEALPEPETILLPAYERAGTTVPQAPDDSVAEPAATEG